MKMSALSLLLLFAGAGAAWGQSVEICHHPPGNTDNAQSLSVSENAVQAHLAHGDTRGPCGEAAAECLCPEGASYTYSTASMPFPGHLYCAVGTVTVNGAATSVTGGRLAVCRNGAPVCQSLDGTQTFPLEACAGCLPATAGGTTYTSCP